MKKMFFPLAIFIIAQSALAQVTDTGTNVGIGVSSPAEKLHINGAIRLGNGVGSWRFVTNSSGSFSIKETGFNGSINIYQSGANNVDLLNLSDGQVGIGTKSPLELLDVEGDAEFGDNVGLLKIKQGNLNFEGNERSYLYHDRSTNRKIGLGILDNSSVQNYIELFEGNSPSNQYIDFGVYGNSAMRINAQGEVGIGTIDFSGNHKLRVEGSIGAREIKVEASGWSDFVFYDDYELRTLEEVEQHIKDKGHLPEVPSEADVTENGINLGEMDAKLLQKIEELTLYLIEQNKQNQAQHAKIELLEKKISQLENK